MAGGRQFLLGTEQYRLTQRHEVEYSDVSRDEFEITYDVENRAVHEQLIRNGVEIDRWVTPERTFVQSVDRDANRSDRWRTETVGPTFDSNADDAFDGYPFDETTVAALIESASFELEDIVTEGDRSYARYTGEIVSVDSLELRQPESARVEYDLDSVSGGNVAIWLAESGAIHAVEYGFSGEAIKLTHEGREGVGFEASGAVSLELDDLDPLTKPKWASADSSADLREFGFMETSLGRSYSLVAGPSLPGSVDLEYSQFYLTVQFGEDLYLARYTPRTEFDADDGVIARFDDSELEMDWASMPGRDALEEADRIELSVYLYAPNEGRTMVFHEQRYP